MADRSRRVRRQISDTPDEASEVSASDSGEESDPRRSDSVRRAGKNTPTTSPAASRTRRTGDDSRQSIKLTMKVAPSKLREVMRANEVDALQDTLGGGKVIDGPRSRRAVTAGESRASARMAARSKYVEYGESDIEEDEDEEEDVEEEEMNDYDEVGAEAEGGTDDEDVEMEDAALPPPKRAPAQPKPPKITLKAPPAAQTKQGARAKVVVKPAAVGPVKSVEEQEIEDDAEGDEEESELTEEDITNLNEEDAEGEEELLDEEDIEGEEEEIDDDDDDELSDSDEEMQGSGANTPDPGRLTKRQRGVPEDQGGLMALDMAPQQRKFFTDEEKAMKKDEHARKRKELTKRKIIEEKTAALNRLLKPQANKARGAAPKPETLAAAAAAAATGEIEVVEKANPLYTRWISSKEGVKLGVPEEWLGKRVGKAFGPPSTPSNGSLVQELA